MALVRSKVPVGVLCWEKTFGSRSSKTKKTKFYQASVLILTFMAYLCYHMAKRPITVVKGTLNPNCTIDGNNTCKAWQPFSDPDKSKKLFGEMDSAFLFSYAIAMFFSGYLAEHTSLRKYLGFGMILTGIVTAVFGLAYYLDIHSLGFFFSLQIVTGMFQATGWPCVVAVVGNWFDKGRRGLVMGIWNCHVYVGNVVGSAVAGIWADKDWGMSFVVPGAVIAVCGVITLLFLVTHPSHVGLNIAKPKTCASSMEKGRESVSSASTSIEIPDGKILPKETEVKPATDLGAIESVMPTRKPDKQAVGFLRALCIPGVIEYSICLFFAKLTSYTFLYWLPFYLKNSVIGGQHFDSERAADLAIPFDVGGAIGGIIAGYLSDRTNCSGIVIFVMLLMAAPSLFVYKFYGNASLGSNITYMLMAGIFVNGPYGLITTAVSANLGSHKSLKGNTKAMATVTSIIDGTGSLGAAVGPLMAGVVSCYGWNDVFYLLIIVELVAALFLTRQVKHELVKLSNVLSEYRRKSFEKSSKIDSEKDPLVFADGPQGPANMYGSIQVLQNPPRT